MHTKDLIEMLTTRRLKASCMNNSLKTKFEDCPSKVISAFFYIPRVSFKIRYAHSLLPRINIR